jgi:hypothetical protein
MCYDDGALQEYIDREMPGRKRWEVEAHIAACEQCKKRLEKLERANKAAALGLSAMSREIDSGEDTAEQAWVRLIGDERFGAPAGRKGAFEMKQDKVRKILVPVAAVAVITIALSFAPVRSFAADILNIFRVEKIETVTISTDDMRHMERQMGKLGSENGGIADLKNFGKIESTGFRAPEDMNLADAEKAAGFELKLPAGIDASAETSKAQVQIGSEVSFTLDVKKANKLIESSYGNVLLPDELDGKKFTIKIPTVVAIKYEKTGNGIMVAQAKSPEMIMPDGVDPLVVRSVLLNLPMLPENIKKQLVAIQDWKHTLIIPNIEGSSQDVDVNGTQGVFIQPPKKDGGENVLIWQKDGIVFAIGGKFDLEGAQDIAAAMK